MRLGLLLTDKCFFIVLAVILLVLINSLRHAPNRLAFRHVFSKPVSVSSAIVLLFFLTIGVLDSLHFKPDSRSLLDKLLAPVGEVYEKTYSAPFALKLFSSEITIKNGLTEMTHPRLVQVNPALKSSVEKHQLIKTVVLKALLWSVFSGIGCWLLLAFRGLILTAHRKSMSRGLYAGAKNPESLLDKKHNTRLVGMIERLRSIVKLTSTQMSAILTLSTCIFFMLAAYWISRDLHVLGTGKIGQDIFYSTVKSIRTGLVIGILTTLFMLPLALLLGVAAGYFGGVVDDIIQYIYTTLSSIPGVLLITASVLSMQTYIANHPEQFLTLNENADARLLALCMILGVTSWTSLCRLLRAEALKLKEIDYVLAAKALGSSAFYIIRKHLLPNVMHIVIITFVLDFSFLVLAEAVLSYVGVGVSPLTMSWGNMINAARLELAREPLVWWPMFAAFLLMFTLVLASNLFADAIEDAFNPKRDR